MKRTLTLVSILLLTVINYACFAQEATKNARKKLPQKPIQVYTTMDISVFQDLAKLVPPGTNYVKSVGTTESVQFRYDSSDKQIVGEYTSDWENWHRKKEIFIISVKDGKLVVTLDQPSTLTTSKSKQIVIAWLELKSSTTTANKDNG